MTLFRRFALILFIVLVVAGGAAPAVAGEYPVYACEPGAGDVNRAWVAEWNHGGVLAYVRCPPAAGETAVWNRGLVVRSATVPSNPNATIPGWSYAALVFRAPPGAALSRISYDHDLCGWSGFKSGLINGANVWLRAAGPSVCGTWFGPKETLPLGGTNLLKIITICAERVCSVGGRNPSGYAAFRSATVVVADHTLPRVSLTGGSALAGGWRRGRVDVGVSAVDNVGIRYAQALLDGRGQSSWTNTCDYTRTVPCPALTRSLAADTRIVADGRHILSVRVRDAANNWGAASSPLLVDNTPPSGPINLSLVGGQDWRQSNNFSIAWRNPRQAGTAPITAIETAVCPAENGPETWSGCTYRRFAKRDITSLSGLRVPRAGDWVGRFWLRDAAGNHDRRTAETVRLRLDDAPPTLSFMPPNASDPGRIDVRASDATSPLTRTEVEFRRRGRAAWTGLRTTPSPSGFFARLDDEHLANGIYELRARAFDSAGNERSTNRDATGAVVIRRVPLRIDTRLVAGQVKYRSARRSRGGKRRKRRVIVVRPTVRYGRTIPIRGRLTTPGANPVANASVEVWERVSLPRASWRRVAMIGTDRRGRFKFKALRGPSRVLRFRYPGTPLVRARTTEVEIHVRATTSIRPSRRRVVNGDEVMFRGRVRGRPLPATGKLIQLQAYSRGQWLTFATPRASARSGRWRHRYRFTATRGTVRYRFRARLPRESGYPYDAGTSRRVGVIVRGL